MLLIFIISLIIYTMAIIMIYHNVYNFEKASKIKFISIGIIVTFIITLIICFICSNGVVIKGIDISTVRNMPIFLFAPINAIICLPYIGNVFNKYKDKRITEDQVKRRLTIFFIVLILVFIFEMRYINDFETGLANILNQKNH